MQEMNGTQAADTRRMEWIEPEVRQLDVRETAFRPHAGNDGEARFSDCSRS